MNNLAPTCRDIYAYRTAKDNIIIFLPHYAGALLETPMFEQWLNAVRWENRSCTRDMNVDSICWIESKMAFIVHHSKIITLTQTNYIYEYQIFPISHLFTSIVDMCHDDSSSRSHMVSLLWVRFVQSTLLTLYVLFSSNL